MSISDLFRAVCCTPSSRRRFRAPMNPLPGSQTLEARIVPATLVNPMTLTYRDFDGDDVTVQFSAPLLDAGNVNSVFVFNNGNVNGSNALPQQLRSINLSGLPAAAGTALTTVAIRNPATGGDGFAALGQLNATGRDLGAIKIDGDLGRILAGDVTTATPGVSSLSVHSMGRFGTISGATNLVSRVHGTLDSLVVKADIKGAFIEVFGGVNGRVNTLSVGGSMLGNGSTNSGRVHAHGNLGKVTVGRDVLGGNGSHSGAITSFADISSVSIGGSLVAGKGSFSGMIRTDINGGGHTEGEFGGHIGLVTVGRDVVGGLGLGSGTIASESGNLGDVTINGSVTGGPGSRTGQVYALSNVGNVIIGRNIVGGLGMESGLVFAGSTMGNVTVRGSVRGGAGEVSGEIKAVLSVGIVNITGDVVGGDGRWSGQIYSTNFAAVNIGGSVRGAAGEQSGTVMGNQQGLIPALRITGDVVGGAGYGSGTVGGTRLNLITIGGSLIGGSSSYSGRVNALGISTITISGNIQGGSATGTQELVSSGVVHSAGDIVKMTVLGSIIAGTDSTTGVFEKNGAIGASDRIGSLTIQGNIVGNQTNTVLISARGQAAPPAVSDSAIGTLEVTGFVEYALIYAGIDWFGGTNADAQIGTVTIGGDWVASNLIAGANTGADGVFGTQDDLKLSGPTTKDLPGAYSRINNLTIGGQLLGTEFTNDHFGVVAESVVNLSIGGNVIPMLAGRHNDDILLILSLDGFYADFWLHEI